MNKKYRHTIIAGNWKMNTLPSEVKAYASELKALTEKYRQGLIIVCTPFVSIPAAVKAFKGAHVYVGAQNLSEHDKGAYTGEVSAAQLKDAGAAFVIIGHSERRTLFNESDATVNKKMHIALNSALKPILCVGETEQERKLGVTLEIIALQLKTALSGITPANMRKVVIAYEPVWAIGTGLTATPEDAELVCREIRSHIRKLYGARIARAISILYGGSMNEKNAKELLAQPNIDGGLIGGASLSASSFVAIAEAAEEPGE